MLLPGDFANFRPPRSGLFPRRSLLHRDLDVYTDADLSMRTHVHRTIAGSFAVLHQIRSIRRSLPPTALQTLVASLVLSWQRGARGHPGVLAAPPAVCVECCGQVNHRSSTLGAHQHIARWPTLAPGVRAYEIQVGDTDVPLPARHSSPLAVRSSSPSGGRSDLPSPTVIFKRRALDPPDTACHHWRSGDITAANR
jgi:hypothetical protein